MSIRVGVGRQTWKPCRTTAGISNILLSEANTSTVPLQRRNRLSVGQARERHLGIWAAKKRTCATKLGAQGGVQIEEV
jgi:hypothetical protein